MLTSPADIAYQRPKGLALSCWRRGLCDRAEGMSFVPAAVDREASPRPTSAASAGGGEIVIEVCGMTIRPL